MRVGSLCSGAGGLDLAVEQVFGAETVWQCELDSAASKVLAHRWPGVPNYRDLTAMGWHGVEPIGILCAGWPCQPFSLAGKQKGAADERAIWPEIARAVRVLRPRIVVLENVSAVLRVEFGRVADSLAALGYDLRWTCLRASDVGAPHRRERLFVVATDTNRAGRGDTQRNGQPPQPELAASFGRDPRGRGDDAAPVDLLPTPAAARSGRNQSPSPGAAVRPSLDMIGDLLPTPTSRDHKGRNQRGDDTCLTGAPLPTPRTSDTNGAGAHGDGGLDLRTAITLLPTPTMQPETSNGHARNLGREVKPDQWGKYAPAIARWEAITRPAPSPTEPNTKGNPRLNPAFSEWMMGWPAGWVTQVPGISRNDALRIIGNGVVPQCAAAALTWLLSLEAVA